MASPLDTLRQALASQVVESQGLSPDLVPELVRQTRIPDAEHGDLALPCFALSKKLKKKPAEIASQVVEALKGDPRWAKVEAAGPYVNVRFESQALAVAVVEAGRQASFGTSQTGQGKTVVIDFSSPNIAKPLAFHHVRSTVIGAALTRLHQAEGWKVVGINYLGDWGKQFGLLATGFSRHGDPHRRADAKHLVEIYVKANQEADVGACDTRIQRPVEAEALKQKVEALNQEQDASGPTPATRKSLKSLEKKIRKLRPELKPEQDPFETLDAWIVALREDQGRAEAERPEKEAKNQEARLYLKRMEDKDPAALAEWEEFRRTSIEEFERVYARMGIRFDFLEGESLYTDVLEDTLARVRNKPGTRISDGAEIAVLDYKKGEPPVLLKTRDGTTLYLTRDIAAATDRFDRFSFDRSLYVVSTDQTLHFQQLFRTLKAMELPWADRCHHVNFGRIHGMATRRGSVIFLDEVLDESASKARAICEESGKIDPKHLDEVVEAIGVGAIVFGDLHNLRTTDYHFSWEEVLNFSGHTGPYVQYTHARTCSIIRKAGGVPKEADLGLLTLEEEHRLLVALARYPDAVRDACHHFEPSILTRSVLEVAQATAHYLTSGNKDASKRILLDDPPLKAARLHLVDAVRNTLHKGLQILGLQSPEAM